MEKASNSNSALGKGSGAGPSKKELIEISFRPAKGGLVSNARFKSKGGDDYMSHSETAIHPKVGMKHLMGAVGGHLKKKETGAKKEKSASMRKG